MSEGPFCGLSVVVAGEEEKVVDRHTEDMLFVFLIVRFQCLRLTPERKKDTAKFDEIFSLYHKHNGPDRQSAAHESTSLFFERA